MTAPRICVIGAGPAGLSTLIQLKLRQEEGHGPYEVTCFESQPTWGGIWNLTWRTGLDEHGERVHSAMYYDLWSNGPFEINEFPDYTLIEHFKKPIPSFPPREAILDYLKGRWSKYDVKNLIQFNTIVRHVTFDDATEKFTVVTEQLLTKEKKTEVFDYVFVCTSFAANPYTPPAIKGVENITGRIMHSHNLRTEFRDGFFRGKSVLLIGASYSAEDAYLQCVKFGAKEVHIAYNRAPLGDVPAPGFEHPMVTHFEGSKTAYFKDGTSVDVDVIIFCTGYRLNYSFMEDKLRHVGKPDWYHENLYNTCMWLKGGKNKLFYLGTLFTEYTFTMYEIQAVWASKVIAGILELPPKKEIEVEIEEWKAKLSKIDPKDTLPIIQYQTDLLNHLVRITNYGHSLDCSELWLKTVTVRHQNLLTHREHSFKSLHTGIQSPIPKIPFLENFDDSMAAFLAAL